MPGLQHWLLTAPCGWTRHPTGSHAAFCAWYFVEWLEAHDSLLIM